MLKIDLMRPDELGDAVRLFVDAVHQINRADYAPEQLDAWAPDDAAFRAQLQNKLASSLTLAARDGDTLVGFGSLLGADELDMLYVDPGHLRRGVGRALVFPVHLIGHRVGEFALKIQPEHPEKDEKDEGENLPGRRPCPETEEPDEAEHPAKPPPRREPAGVAGGIVRRAPGRERRAHHRDDDIKDIDEQQRAGREHWQIAGLVGVGREIHRFNPAGVVE